MANWSGIRREKEKNFDTRDDEENQEINDIPVIEERIQNESGPVEPSETEIVYVSKLKLQIKNALSMMSWKLWW